MKSIQSVVGWVVLSGLLGFALPAAAVVIDFGVEGVKGRTAGGLTFAAGTPTNGRYVASTKQGLGVVNGGGNHANIERKEQLAIKFSDKIVLLGVEMWFELGKKEQGTGADPFYVNIGDVSILQPPVSGIVRGTNVVGVTDRGDGGVYVTYGVKGTGDMVSFHGGDKRSSFRVKSIDVAVVSTPEPGTLGLLALGLIGIGFARGCGVGGSA